jgi:hypothetical protein
VVKWRELEGREPIINTPPLLSRHPKRIREKERFWLVEQAFPAGPAGFFLAAGF